MQRPIVNPSSDMRGAREMDDEASWAAHQEEVSVVGRGICLLCWGKCPHVWANAHPHIMKGESRMYRTLYCVAVRSLLLAQSPINTQVCRPSKVM